MSANTGRAGSGRREAPRRMAGNPPAAPARPATPGRKAAVGLAGFGSAAALAGAGMAMLASPGSVTSAAGPAHTAQPGVEQATLTAKIPASTARTPPQPTLPSNETVAPAQDPPGNLLNLGSQPNNPTEGVQFNGIFPFSTDPGVLFDTPSGSATVKMDLPSMLFGDPAGGSGTFTATSGQAGSLVNSLFGNITVPQQQDLGSFVQSMRLPDGTLPFSESQLADNLAAGANQNAVDAFNAEFGQGGQVDTLLNNTQVPAPEPFSNFNPSDLFGALNPATSAPNMGSSDPAFGAPASGTLGTSPDPAFGAPASGTLGTSPDPAFGAPASGTLETSSDTAPASTMVPFDVPVGGSFGGGSGGGSS